MWSTGPVSGQYGFYIDLIHVCVLSMTVFFLQITCDAAEIFLLIMTTVDRKTSITSIPLRFFLAVELPLREPGWIWSLIKAHSHWFTLQPCSRCAKGLLSKHLNILLCFLQRVPLSQPPASRSGSAQINFANTVSRFTRQYTKIKSCGILTFSYSFFPERAVSWVKCNQCLYTISCAFVCITSVLIRE